MRFDDIKILTLNILRRIKNREPETGYGEYTMRSLERVSQLSGELPLDFQIA